TARSTGSAGAAATRSHLGLWVGSWALGAEEDYAHRHCDTSIAPVQNRPTTFPVASMSMVSAPGTFGRPGIVRMSPAYATTKPAPAESAASRIVTVNPRGRPRRFGSSLSELCVLATHTGSRPYPSASNRASLP